MARKFILVQTELTNVIDGENVTTLGVPVLTESAVAAASQMPYQAPAAAADVAALKAQFDALLGKLVTAGLMAAS